MLDLPHSMVLEATAIIEPAIMAAFALCLPWMTPLLADECCCFFDDDKKIVAAISVDVDWRYDSHKCFY
jgi:hypothetical protein